MFSWKILELYSEAKSVRFLLKATDGTNTVETEGNHEFSEGIVNKPFSEIVEQDLINWLENDAPIEIKQNIENQLKTLENSKKVDMPWLANTFTI